MYRKWFGDWFLSVVICNLGIDRKEWRYSISMKQRKNWEFRAFALSITIRLFFKFGWGKVPFRLQQANLCPRKILICYSNPTPFLSTVANLNPFSAIFYSAHVAATSSLSLPPSPQTQFHAYRHSWVSFFSRDLFDFNFLAGLGCIIDKGWVCI